MSKKIKKINFKYNHNKENFSHNIKIFQDQVKHLLLYKEEFEKNTEAKIQ